MHRRSSSGDRLSITPENLSPSPGSSPGLQVTHKGSPYSGSSLEVATTSSDYSSDHRSSSGPTSYNSSTLPLRRPRSKISAEEKSRKVMNPLLIIVPLACYLGEEDTKRYYSLYIVCHMYHLSAPKSTVWCLCIGYIIRGTCTSLCDLHKRGLENPCDVTNLYHGPCARYCEMSVNSMLLLSTELI